MTQKVLAEMFGLKAHQISAKCSSSNQVSRILTKVILAMPDSMVKPFIEDELVKDKQK